MAQVAEPATIPRDLTVDEGFSNPLGFHNPRPRFSWKLPVSAKRQTAYRLEVSSRSHLWDSGWVESEQSTFVPYEGPPFGARERVTWRVNVRDERRREFGWSATAGFELGLLSADDWQASWIRPAQASDPIAEPVASLRRSFALAQTVARARLYVTAHGLFTLSLNGSRVGTDHFANGFTPYDTRIDTLTYDVTDLLKSGENHLLVSLATGWYAGRYPFETKQVGPYGPHPELLAQLELTFEDGSTRQIVTDGAWEGSFHGPIRSASLYDGEHYDARQVISDWQPVLANPRLGSARLQPKPFAPVRAATTLAACSVVEAAPGRWIFDLGQNIVGWARIHIPAEADQTVTLRFAEMLQADGTLYTANYRTAKSTDTYTASDTGPVTWEPQFTFHGFRYVELSGLPADSTP